MASFALTRVASREQWDAFVLKSRQGSIFTSSAFLAAACPAAETWFLEKDGVPVAGVAVALDGSRILAQPLEYSSYIGICYAPVRETLPWHSQAPWTLRVTEELLSALAERYARLSFSFHPNCDDIRAIQWFNYHESNKGRFRIELRYTARLDLSGCDSIEAILRRVRPVRGEDLRKARRAGLQIEECSDPDLLGDLRERTFLRQGIELSESDRRQGRALTAAALDGGFGSLLVARSPAGEAVAATLFLHDSDTGYYLFGATDPSARKTGVATYLLLENIERHARKGLKEIDFVGINSPSRGDFKISFNGRPTPYFEAHWDRPLPIIGQTLSEE